MRHCDKCGIDFSGDLERCPLCQAELTGEASAPMFPPNVLKRSGAIALRVIAFATGVAIIVMLFLTRMVKLPSDVVFTVCLALLINYAFVRHIIGHAPDFLRLVARYFLVLLACALLGFVLTGNYAWSTFVVPGISLAALVTDAVLVCVFRKDFVSGYA